MSNKAEYEVELSKKNYKVLNWSELSEEQKEEAVRRTRYSQRVYENFRKGLMPKRELIRRN